MAGRGLGERYRLQQTTSRTGQPISYVPTVSTVPVAVPTLDDLVTQPGTPSPELVAFESKLSTLPIELQKAYTQGGVEGYNNAVETYNAQQKAAYDAQVAAQQKNIAASYSRQQAAVAAAAPTTDERTRISALQAAINTSEQALADPNSPLDKNQVQQGLDDARAKLAMIQNTIDVRQSYAEASMSIPTDVLDQLKVIETLSNSELSPYYDASTGSLNIAAAVKQGVSNATLTAVGITKDAVKQAEAQNLIQSKYYGDPIKAIEGGDIKAVRTLYGGEATLDLQLGVADKREWERTVLPTLPQEYQDAYKAKDEAKLQSLRTQYTVSQEEFDRWIASDEAPAELKEAYSTGGITEYYRVSNKLLQEDIARTANQTASAKILENLGYRLTYEDLGRPVMTFAGDTSKHYTDQFDTERFLRDAIDKDLSSPKMGPPAKVKQVWNPNKGVWEDTKIASVKTNEQKLAESGPNYLAALKVLSDFGYDRKELSALKTKALSAPGITIGPTTGKRPLGPQIAAQKLSHTLEKWLADKDTQFREKLSVQGPLAGTIAGVGMAGVTAVMGIPMLVAKIGIDPSKTPQVVYGAVKDMGSAIATNLKTIVAGGYTTPYDFAYNTTTTAIILQGAGSLAKGFSGKITTYLSPRGINLSAIAKELSTGRLKIKAGLDQAMVDALTEAQRRAMDPKSPFTGEVPIAGTSLRMRYLKTPINEVVGGVRWHAAQDGLTFIKNQLEVTVTDGKTTVKINLPVGSNMSNALLKLKTYSNQSIAALDTPQVRSLKLSDAADIPKSLAKVIENVIKSKSGTVYGSFVDWIKNRGAIRPNDVDIVFKTAEDARLAKEFISQEATKKGFQVRSNDRGVQILDKGTWKTIANVVDESQHASMVKAGGYKGSTVLSKEGFITETAGTQIVNQALATLESSPKTAIRAGKVSKSAPRIVKIAESQGVSPSGFNTFTAGEAGLYTDPWAAMNYARGMVEITVENVASFPGTKVGDVIASRPGLLMVLEDAFSVKTARQMGKLTQSDKFIKGRKGKTYGPSKMYKGDLETEIVDSPGKSFDVPQPGADLLTRSLAGEFSDFYTFDNGKFVPIKMAIGKGGRVPTITELYTVKLMTLQNALRDTFEAFKHPGAMASDLVRTVESLKNVDLFRRGGGGGNTTFPGVRNVYLETDWVAKIREWRNKLTREAETKVNKQASAKGIKAGTKAYENLVRDSLRDAYDANAQALVSNFRDVASAYGVSAGAREAFEAAYVSQLGRTASAVYNTRSMEDLSAIDVLRDVDTSVTSPSSLVTPTVTTPKSELSQISQEAGTQVSELGTLMEEQAPAIRTESAESTVSRVQTPVSLIRSPVSETTVSSMGSGVTEESRVSAKERPTVKESRPASSSERTVTEEGRPIEESRSPVEEIRSPEERRPPIERRPPDERRPYVERRPYEEYRPYEEIRPYGKYRQLSTIKPLITDSVSSGAGSQRIPAGSITWYQGEMLQGKGKGRMLRPVWKYIPPEDFVSGAKPRTLYAPPVGAKHTDVRTARGTIQVIGKSGAGTPDAIDVDLGWADITVVRGKEIQFKGGGGKTNVGTRIDSTTSGMSVDDSGGYADDTSSIEVPTSRGVNRKLTDKSRPKKVSKRITSYERMTTLKGFRI